MKLLDKIRDFAPTIPGLVITIVAGGAGLAMPGYGKSALAHLKDGNVEGAFASAGYNYLGVDLHGPNTFGSMWARAKGLKVAIAGKFAKMLLAEM
jgi:hypothetical protein